VLGLGSTYLAYSIYYAGLKYLEATRAAVAATLEPVAAAVLAYIWWDEYFNLLGYAGSGLILGAVLLTMYDGARQRRLASKALLTDHA
jgi:DME family drug/metabolite transporter